MFYDCSDNILFDNKYYIIIYQYIFYIIINNLIFETHDLLCYNIKITYNTIHINYNSIAW